ncbi:MAG: ABC transporter substrate-binding protein [Undibacterium sp.]|uniref:ABC transporter substrate-binding protein n=1 Tax=Undibacterium sp. TaxID=1914977 RepID=UPI0027247922|nr:ABC transporter substrate-binding protein [Undibacterium sp.]MDO8653280.1 ABC transporter substrate-binding protein [Undibacterium sp.]
MKSNRQSPAISAAYRLLLAGVMCASMPVGATTSAGVITAIVDHADPAKILRTVFPVAETGFDPAATRDLYSNAINEALFERLYTYDYLASPAKVVPETADGMPAISADGKTYTIKLKKGIYFIPDEAFNGKKRELSVEDYVYSFKRMMDPKIASSHTWLLDGKIIGLDQLAADAKKSGKFDYNKKIAGFEVVDSYTLRIHLTRPDYNFPMILAYTPMSAVAREVIEKYRDVQGLVMAHPVGTGPYQLIEWVRGSKMVLDANPDFRPMIWDFQASADPDDQKIIAAMKGKRMPQIGRIVVNVMLEDQSRLLAFQKDETDLFQLYGGLAPQVLRDGKLKPEFVKKGVQLSRIVDPELTVYYWNMQDPVFGGFSKEKIALRRAMAMAHNVEEEIRIVDNGDAIALQYPIPPGVVGHDPNYKSSVQYNPAAANALLDKFSYKKGKDGYRTLPDGSPLLVTYTANTDSRGHIQGEVWKKTYDSIGIRMKADFRPFAELLKAEKNCQLTQRNSPWMADYPDGDNFMQLFYGRNIHQNNNGCVTIPEYDQLYEQSQKLPDGPERDLLYHKMTRIMEVNAAQRVGFARYRNMLAQARVLGYKKHPILHIEWMYLDIDKSK